MDQVTEILLRAKLKRMTNRALFFGFIIGVIIGKFVL